MTTATCSDLQLTTNAVVCSFRVSNALCYQDGIQLYSSPEVTARLKGNNLKRTHSYHAENEMYYTGCTVYKHACMHP